MLQNIVTGKKRRPRRVLLYGAHGIGKSGWLGSARKILVMQTEDGLDDIGVDRTPLLTELGQVMEWLSTLISQPHDYRWVGIDTLDFLEQIIHRQVARDASKRSIEEIPYGKGYVLAQAYWQDIIGSLETLRNTRNMNVGLIAHARIVRFNDPTTDAYDRYEPDLHKSICAHWQEWCDEFLFATYRVATIRKEQGFSRERVRAVGGDRVVYTCEAPTHLAKRRCSLPDELPLDFSAYLEALKAATDNGQGNIEGVVVDGSSKKRSKDNG